jgi:hypothetical protein
MKKNKTKNKSGSFCAMLCRCPMRNLAVSIVVSPIIIYGVLLVAKLFGAHYTMSHGDTFIIWLLMAILINLNLKK